MTVRVHSDAPGALHMGQKASRRGTRNVEISVWPQPDIGVGLVVARVCVSAVKARDVKAARVPALTCSRGVNAMYSPVGCAKSEEALKSMSKDATQIAIATQGQAPFSNFAIYRGAFKHFPSCS